MATRTNAGLSLLLSRILDSYGLDEENRQRRMDCQKIRGLLLLDFPSDYAVLLSGSAFETTTIDGLSSDFDMMIVDNAIRVIDDIKQWNPDKNKLTFMMDNTGCYKGFVKLYLLSEDYPGPEYSDRETQLEFYMAIDEGKIWLPNKILNEELYYSMSEETPNIHPTLHGPAITGRVDLTEYKFEQEFDVVFTLFCQSFPREASGWKERQSNKTRARRGGTVIDQAKHCYLVGVGNTGSPKEHLEWRWSFSHIENQLVHNWNNIQYKCYVMMKFINKDLIKPFVPDVLCSYHFKTILMWMVEEYESDFFIETNFENCLIAIIRNLSLSVRNKSLPHYFVEGCNLFYNKINDETRNGLTAVLEKIIHTWPFCLFNIERRGLGNAISKVVSNQNSIDVVCSEFRMERRLMFNTALFELFNEFMLLSDTIKAFKFAILQKEPKNAVKELFRFKTKMHTEYVCTKETEQCTTFIVKDILCCVGLLQIYRSDGMPNKRAFHYKRSGLGCIDRYSNECGIDTRLEIAGHFTVVKNYDRAIVLLDETDNQIKPYTAYVCSHKSECKNNFEEDFLNIVFDNNPSINELFKHYIASAIEYSRDRMLFVPRGLVYEMFRTTSVSPAVSDLEDCDWYKHAVVHCPMYLYYLRFLCYDALRRYPHRQVALDNMIWASEKLAKTLCSHLETNHNIIGYCYRSIENTREAYKEYRKSLAVKKYHNSAIWHLAVLLRSKVRRDQ